MAHDVADTVGTAIGRVAREAAKSLSHGAGKRSGKGAPPIPKGVAAGVGLAALTPLAVKGAGKVVKGVKGAVGDAADGANPLAKAAKLGKGAKDAKDAVADKVPGGGGKSKGVPGVGKGRRMPIQQDIDIGVPIETVYEQWTQFEEWPEFMHRLQNVKQEDDTHVSFKTKIWGVSKEFKAEIVEQQPNKRIKWEVVDGVTHTGVVTFHELAPTLTRVEVNLDVQPGSMLEKAARGMRHIKRAVRADLARFKAHTLMEDDGDDQSSSGSSGSSSQRSSG
jgi:uncharacterized membrane protein